MVVASWAALTTQIDALAETWNSFAIVGSAMFATDEEIADRNVPSATPLMPSARARGVR